MNLGTDEIALGDREAIDALADRFEREFRSGRKPEIEAFLLEKPELRPHLLQELLGVELELRRAAGEQPGAEAYRQRFPEDHSIVEAVFYPPTKTASEIVQPVATEADEKPPEPEPERLGRYVIQRRLGKGGFGVVYLAEDPQLQRPVAIKVPRRKRFKTAEQVASFIEEARTAAQLKHPGLVSVHDVQEENGLPYIVQEYIDGSNLGQWAAKQQSTFEQIARVLVGITEALGYAHLQGLTHCDLKLANVLIDSAGQPHVADFGLAVHESRQALRKGVFFGTLATMAPEQVRGEGHRLDGRTDIWAIGVMFYELLVGRRPFAASNNQELFNEIQTLEPKPPRQIDRSVPHELQRICLKCLAKHKSERYNTVDELGDDLTAWLSQAGATQPPKASPIKSAADAAVVAPDSSSRSQPPAKIIPKGLRSFDAGDADFFLDLLPGPRDRDGLPDSIRFWKQRIEETDPDQTFSVGLIYGPSGCGKSSLVKAGLLPRLSENILPIYVEATSDDTEVRILKQLRKHLARLPADISLVDACAEIRLTGAGRQRKVLLVIDQFEQWLHSHPELKQAQLVDALRQCEGERLQAIVLVRDDFFASVHRLFQALDDPLIEGRNYALIDKFDVDHARKVLIAFGRAYGKLGESLDVDQARFVEQAVRELTEDAKVICVRLSLFADMMKLRSWIPTSLQDVGGVGGVGMTFLEETFSAKAAPPSHRVQEAAIRKVLKALLPEASTDIKGGMQSEQSLRAAAGYHSEPQRFAEVVRILDQELRIITPTEPDGEKLEVGSEKSEGRTSLSTLPASHFYQLTHDYLVPSLRGWLTRKQKETRRGRAELKLEERAALWHAKPENRHLPGVIEWANIRLLTSRQSWTDLQRTVMRKAARLHSTVGGILLIVVLVAGLAIQQYFLFREGELREKETLQLIAATESAVNSVESNSGSAIPFVLERLDQLPVAMVENELRLRFAKATGQNKLSLAYALARFGQVDVDTIVAAIADIDTQGSEVSNIVAALISASDLAKPALQSAAMVAGQAKDWRAKMRLAVVAMYLGDVTIAAEMLRAEPETPNQPLDPVERTEFIAEFPEWHGDLEKLAELMQSTDDPALRSGISLAVGNVARPGESAKAAWGKVLADWHANELDSGTHSAAGWATRQWGLAPAKPVITSRPSSPKVEWWHARDNLTMVKIPAGSVASDKLAITLTDPYWLSDREISIELFKQFMADPQAQKPDMWEGAYNFDGDFDDSHPVQQVSWEEAVMFCNWLSARHGSDPSYKIERLSTPIKSGSRIIKAYEVELLQADGFRLPTEMEWEYACRALTTTTFASGDDEERLREYATFNAFRTTGCGSKLCNVWGLFDMHGNVDEWCWDPNVSESSLRVNRGGSWGYSARLCRSSARDGDFPPDRYYSLGFRVAQGLSSSQSSSGAESAGLPTGIGGAPVGAAEATAER